MYAVFDSLLRWTGRGVPNAAVGEISAAIVAAFPGRAVYYTHDTLGFELVSGDVTLAEAMAGGDAEMVS